MTIKFLPFIQVDVEILPHAASAHNLTLAANYDGLGAIVPDSRQGTWKIHLRLFLISSSAIPQPHGSNTLVRREENNVTASSSCSLIFASRILAV